jgi:UDP:flavonoid glycosyltransferase YjiC (YdhE family)
VVVTTQWPKEKVQKDQQGSTNHTHKTKDRVTRTPLKTGHTVRTILKYHTVRTIIKYHTVRTIIKSNIKIVERDKIYTPNREIHDRLLSWLGTDTSITSGRVNQAI